MPNTNSLKNRSSEAALYALLRRLVPAIRHNMMGTLQPVSMMAAMLEKRLQASTPDLALLGKHCASLKDLSREASSTSTALMSWLQPQTNERVGLQAGIEDAVSLVSSELSFRGFTLVNQTAGVHMDVPQDLLRHVFLASLMALTDAAPCVGAVLLTAHAVDDALVLDIEMTAVKGDAPLDGYQAYRALDWDDVQSLADDAEGVSFKRDPGSVTLRWRSVAAAAGEASLPVRLLPAA